MTNIKSRESNRKSNAFYFNIKACFTELDLSTKIRVLKMNKGAKQENRNTALPDEHKGC